MTSARRRLGTLRSYVLSLGRWGQHRDVISPEIGLVDEQRLNDGSEMVWVFLWIDGDGIDAMSSELGS